ncbi:queuosine precursor transporter [Candidatus Nomurabacteria bacterium]|nr:queuosine precursor transporter [Candidatus Saccharibacteria bacterium]MCB9839761.1 queuosine precursor transporter [Candidatus Nomurabacteria bacterium]
MPKSSTYKKAENFINKKEIIFNDASTRQFKYYDLVLALFVSFLLISNISAVKIIDIRGFLTDGGALLFPLTYIFGDILTEIYGLKYARRAILTAFFVMALASVVFLLVGIAPGGADWNMQDSWNDILGFVPRIVIASLVAFLIGQFVNSYVLVKIKQKYGAKRLWVRLIGSTVVAQLLDTVIFTLIAFSGSGFMNSEDTLKYIIQGWIFKTLIEVAMLPITYQVIGFLRKKERIT